jgi:DNA-directed RNA polymerase subunit M/transcription elongation factor TFIIS|tara:strand:- start:984 stop:1205 length:222 start_codon:yes stop_codon:yes gene_type:complete
MEVKKMGKLKDRLSQVCGKCRKNVLARRIEGRYVNERETRLLVWECPSCNHLWRESNLATPKFKKHKIGDLNV